MSNRRLTKSVSAIARMVDLGIVGLIFIVVGGIVGWD
jgi:hypothetical protein